MSGFICFNDDLTEWVALSVLMDDLTEWVAVSVLMMTSPNEWLYLF